MRISVVSPSFNQAGFIHRTIDSVAEQTYPDKQHVIVDGVSTDGSVDIIRKAARTHRHLTAIVEPDRGQSDAINKGFRQCDGDILGWLNTDDFYHDPGVFERVARAFADNPDADVIYGRGWRLAPSGERIREAWINRDLRSPWDFWKSMGILQPSLFFRRRVFDSVGGLKDEYGLQLDYDYWIRIAKAGFRFRFVDDVLSCATVHEDAKSTRARLAQLSECIAMLDAHFGEVPSEWFARLGDFFVTEIDQKTETGQGTRDARARTEAANTARFVERACKGADPATRPRARCVVTAFDSKYFHQGINLIAGLHRSSFLSFDRIFVYSLDLSAAEIAWLESLHKVEIARLPSAPADFPDFHDPKGRAYKSAAIATEGLAIPDGAAVLWMDAGITPCTDIEAIFAQIEKDDFFITNHDDSRHWPFYNIQFTHPAARAAIGATTAELLAPQLCSALVGYRKGGRYQGLIDEARRLGRRRDAVMWAKVIARDDPARGPSLPRDEIEELRARTLDEAPPASALQGRFPYYGHRTQSIYSVLCHRMSAPVQSSTRYRRGNEASTRAAQRNWTDGADKTRETAGPASSEILEGLEPDTLTFHHRGTCTDLSGLMHRRCLEPAFVVGNGPSLAGFDFQRLKGRVWVGMNAAYRYWDQIGIYPTIYCCLDLVVQDSHKEEIRRLIERRREYGIAYFFLRRTFVDYWPEVANEPGVFFLDDLGKDCEWFDRGKVTTGSFSAYFCAFLGHADIYLLGIDLNYVEKIDEAEVAGRELVISRQVDNNPNYFFDGYQQPGDRYNPPNRHADMHLRSWTECAEVLRDWGVAVRNCNPDSAVTCFPFDSIDKVLGAADDPLNRAMFLARDFSRLVARQTVFRNRFLARIGATPERFVPGLDQIERIAAWRRSVAPAPGTSLPAAPTGAVTGRGRKPDAGAGDRALLAGMAARLLLGGRRAPDDGADGTRAEAAIDRLGPEDDVVRHFRDAARFAARLPRDARHTRPGA